MGKKKPQNLKLMYKGKNLMDDFVWATVDEVKQYQKKGYKLVK